MQQRARLILSQQGALQKKAHQLRTEEMADKREEQQLGAREVALNKKEKRLGVLQGELMQEQRKIWKILQSRGVGPAVGQHIAGQQAVHPPPVQGYAPVARVEQPPQSIPQAMPAARQGVMLAQMPQVQQGLPNMQAVPQMQMMPPAGVALAQTSAAVAAGARAGAEAGSVADVDSGSGAGTQSDLHVVMAARVPPEAESDASSDEDASKGAQSASSSDEDSTPTVQQETTGQDADNDDLEQILLQQQASHQQRKGDAVELQG